MATVLDSLWIIEHGFVVVERGEVLTGDHPPLTKTSMV